MSMERRKNERVIILVGNKLDLITESGQETDKEGQAVKERIDNIVEVRASLADYLSDHPNILSIECSCKSGQNIDAAMYYLVKALITGCNPSRVASPGSPSPNNQNNNKNFNQLNNELNDGGVSPSPLSSSSHDSSSSTSSSSSSSKCTVQ